MVRPESNSRPPAYQPDAQPTEPPVRGALSQANVKRLEFIVFVAQLRRIPFKVRAIRAKIIY